jgi:prefoldin subunit 5
LENLDDDVDINRAWEIIRENIKILAKENRKDEGCSKLLDQRKQAKLQLLQDPRQIDGDNLNNIIHEANRRFVNKKRESLEDKINELAKNSNNENIRDLYRGVNEFNKGYQPRSNLVKGENGDLLADSHNILIKWKN